MMNTRGRDNKYVESFRSQELKPQFNKRNVMSPDAVPADNAMIQSVARKFMFQIQKDYQEGGGTNTPRESIYARNYSKAKKVYSPRKHRDDAALSKSAFYANKRYASCSSEEMESAAQLDDG